MQNIGKKFENNFRAAVPRDVMYYRLPDAPQSFTNAARFSWKNPCDIFLFKSGLLMPLELKTTKDNYYTFEKEKGDNKSAKIHFHQIQGLKEFAEYDNCVPGFILNYRVEKECDYQELTYFIHIDDFIRMIEGLNKKSFNIMDLLKYNPIKIDSTIKRTNFTYDIKKFIDDIKSKNYGN